MVFTGFSVVFMAVSSGWWLSTVVFWLYGVLEEGPCRRGRRIDGERENEKNGRFLVRMSPLQHCKIKINMKTTPNTFKNHTKQ